ncbi:MAG: HD domain-containing protein [Candidatus Omnitrophica bacterium]|nr:HD domain-containing protein [Candidatus Omnitrophota bacterium]
MTQVQPGAIMIQTDILDRLAVLQKLAKRRRSQIYLVGGFLRDRVLGRPLSGKADFDFTVSSGALALARAFAKAVRGAFVLLDREAGCARVARKTPDGILTFDFADFRADDLAGDLRGRDFTINTLALDFGNSDLAALGGPAGILKAAQAHPLARRDLKARVLRMAAAATFVDDPLRILRAYSLKAQLGFRIEPATLKRMKKDLPGLRDVSPERVREELFKVLDSAGAASTLRAMDSAGVLTAVVPQLLVMRGVKQGGYHHLDVWKHTLETVAQFEKLISSLQSDPALAQDLAAYFDAEVAGGHSRRALVKLACLLHDIGKPDTRKKEPEGRTSFHGHEHVGRRIARIVGKQLLLSTRERYALEDMVMLHLRPGYLSNFKRPSDKAVYRFLREAGEEAVSVLLLSLADQYATRGPLTTDYDVRHHEEIAFPLVRAFFARKKEKPFVRFINGHDLIRELKLMPGPAFAGILKAVEEAQHLGKVKTRAEALELARKQVMK